MVSAAETFSVVLCMPMRLARAQFLAASSSPAIAAANAAISQHQLVLGELLATFTESALMAGQGPKLPQVLALISTIICAVSFLFI